MPSPTKRARQQPPASLETVGDGTRRISRTDQLEQTIKADVESRVLLGLLSSAARLHELLARDERFSAEYFVQIEKCTSHTQSNGLINDLIGLAGAYFEQFLSASVMLRCYIHLHAPSTESGNNQGVNIQLQILKEIQEMEAIVESNENILLDYHKKHYEILKSLNKYPSIEDYHLYLIEYESKIFDDIRSMILELRTIFLKTYDIVTKNLTKIRMPRSQQVTGMVD